MTILVSVPHVYIITHTSAMGLVKWTKLLESALQYQPTYPIMNYTIDWLIECFNRAEESLIDWSDDCCSNLANMDFVSAVPPNKGLFRSPPLNCRQVWKGISAVAFVVIKSQYTTGLGHSNSRGQSPVEYPDASLWLNRINLLLSKYQVDLATQDPGQYTNGPHLLDQQLWEAETHRAFGLFLDAIGKDCTILVDYLIAPETKEMFLIFLLRYTRVYCHTTWRNGIDRIITTDPMAGLLPHRIAHVLHELADRLEILAGCEEMLPYRPDALIRRLRTITPPAI
ncbi:hypothetical protein BJ085DRAFT_32867 [Dimargaris cristalligena]|uniref:Uncharacterized protein n=1 Tax=Dimargaris cristalligena TaxID=215637 RepID=A0A4P9ZNC1_9FUNG|nr:hypothetical protein BJ085DRAFT_32867 [Dimargaris cristalligena]|eukprot:RKP33810.1 hypothetical protein BJ085DRAFT_32867 [Dimargaris cristalligena]